MTLFRRTFLPIFLTALWVAASAPAQAQEILPLAQVEAGMRGVARTIFAGQEIEEFDLEILGVLRNLMGPGQHIILARLVGDKVSYTGVVAGMSGIPVYVDGKLVGALALRFGAFTKEPIAGITPFESMQRAAQQEQVTAEDERPRYRVPEGLLVASGVGGAADPYLVPIETPLTFVGFHPQAINRFSQELSQYGFLAVQGGGTAAPDKASPLDPGGAVSAAMVIGDMSVAGTCTITHREGDRLYACGHPILQLGRVALPMTRAEVVATVPSDFNSFKIANIGEAVGTFEQDRTSAIVGRVGPTPQMIPVDLTLRQGRQEDSYHFKIFQHPKLSPLLLNITLFNGLLNSVQGGAEMTYRVSGRMALRGHDDVALDDMFSPTDSLFPDAFFVVNSVGSSFSRIFTNPFEEPQIEGINLTVELLPARHAASIENAWSDKSEVRPGETVMVKVVLQPYRGERLVREVPVTIPAQATKGDMRVLVSDATLLNAITRTLLFGRVNVPGRFAFTPRVTSLDQLVSLLNRERRNDRLYVTVFQRTPTMLVEDKILPSVPLSQINVLNHKSSSVRPGSTLLFYESILNEASEPVGRVITGSHWLRLTVR
jgi:hypothetical protein